VPFRNRLGQSRDSSLSRLSNIAQADSYSRDGDDEATYLLLFRHAHLVLAHLEQHPSKNDPALKSSLAEAQKEVKINLKRLEILKPKIEQRYKYYTKRVQEQEAKRNAQQSSVPHDRDTPVPGVRRLQAHEHTDLAAQLAQREFSRRAASQHRPSRQIRLGSDDFADQLRDVGARIQQTEQPPRQTSQQPPRTNRIDVGYRYPTVAEHHLATPQSLPPPSTQFSDARLPPRLPPKVNATAARPPPLPDKLIENVPARPASPQLEQMFAPSAFLENGNPLRPMFLPPTLRTTFLRLAHKNTQENLETCAFLGGTLMKNAFFVSKLIVPAQTATSDTCEMINESQLFDYVNDHDLMVLGWIHTHPTQTCFMSSRDLHTHSGYQMMLAESVAIVCAPSKGDTTYGGDWGIYRLTDPPGKKAILNCELPGLFHPHEVDNIYTDALKPGHVVELTGMEFEVVDLR
jgi:STAM-binding protein